MNEIADRFAVLNAPELVSARERHFERLRGLFAGEPLAKPFVLWGCHGSGQCDPYKDPAGWAAEALDDLAGKVDLLRDDDVFRPLVVEFDPYGVHFIDRIFGAEVIELTPGNWQVKLMHRPVGALRPPDLENDETWALARRTAEAFLSHNVSVPLFGLPVIASPLNIALNLYGERFVLALYTDPDAARRDLRTINDLLCALHRWYIDRIPESQLQPVVAGTRTQPRGSGQICGCSTQLLSPALYRTFVAPLDNELLSVYPNGGMIHLCGTHTQHIPVWREMRSLRAVQLNDRAAEDLEVYFRELRDDQILYVNAFERMPVHRILDITGGQRVVIVADVKLPS